MDKKIWLGGNLVAVAGPGNSWGSRKGELLSGLPHYISGGKLTDCGMLLFISWLHHNGENDKPDLIQTVFQCV